MTDRLVLQIILCSVRPGRVGEPLARWFAHVARTDTRFDVEEIDLKEVALPFHDEPHHPITRRYTQPHARAWSDTISRGDAYVFVTPEYNHGYSAPTKNAIDYLYHEWSGKPVSFVGYGAAAGGARSVQQLIQVLHTVRAIPIPDFVPVRFPNARLDENGRITPDEAMTHAARRRTGRARSAG